MTGFGDVAERLRRSTVQIADSGGGGSGLLLDAGGAVLTNAHVIRGSTAEVRLWDGARVDGQVVKCDRTRDVAVLQIRASGLLAASTAPSVPLRPGELVIAAGNPLGFLGALSTGVVHAVGPVPGIGAWPWVQSTVRLAPGSSGGPLTNSRGEVIGVNTMIVGMGARHLSLAIPIADALRVAEGRSAGSRPALGLVARPVRIPGERTPGFVILEIAPNGAADRASLLMGDLLIGANGRRFRSFSDLQDAIDNCQAGRLSLQFRRGGSQQRTVTLQLAERRAAA